MNILEALWKDRADIYRSVSTTTNNITKHTDIKIATGIKCKYSQCSATVTDDTNGAPVLKNTNKLFCAPDADASEGDRAVVTLRDGSIVDLRLGECFTYSNNKEFKTERNETV